MNKQLFKFYIAIIILNYTTVYAQQLAGFYGIFADYPLSARSSAICARMASTEETAAIFTNPAALYQTSERAITFSYFKIYNLVSNFSTSIALPVKNGDKAGVAFHTNGDELLRESSTFLGYAQRYYFYSKPIDFGATLAIRYASFGKNSETVGAVTGDVFGFGLTVGSQLWLKRNLILALVLQNFPNYLRWNSSASGTYSENLPVRITMGIAVIDIQKLNIFFDGEKSIHSDLNDRIQFGGEYRIHPIVDLRAGYRWDLFNSIPQNRFSIGIGINYHIYDYPFNFDIAYSWEELPSTLWYTFKINF